MTSTRLISVSVGLAVAAGIVVAATRIIFSARSIPEGDDPAANVVVASYGGSFQTAQTKALFEPYAKATGAKIVGATVSSFPKVKAMVESGHTTWDVVSAESSAYTNEVTNNLLQPLDYSVIKTDGIPAELCTKYGIGYMRFSMNLAWDKDKFPHGVTPAQFFDPAVKARRALMLEPEDTLEFALLADGVKPAELYPLDVGRALKVIGRVKDQIVVYKGPADIQALVQQGEIDMAYLPNGRINNAIKAGSNWTYGWDDSVSDTERWVVIKGAPHAREAMKFINFAVQPVQQAALARQIPYGPTNVNALKLLDPAIAKNLPGYPANAKLGATLNSKWWNENRESVKARWNLYIMQ